MNDLGPVPKTEGWKKLDAWLEADVAPRRTVSSLARAVGVKQPSARAWVKLFARPDGAVLDAVCALTGSTPDEWRTEDELKARAERLRVVEQLTGTEH